MRIRVHCDTSGALNASPMPASVRIARSISRTRGDRFNLLPCSRLVTDNAPESPRGKYKALGWNGQVGLGRTGGQA